MKIAVQFFGHLRTYEKCADSVRKHLLSLYDCDIFMHTWSETEHKTKTWHNHTAKSLVVDAERIEKLKALYNLKDIIVEKQEPAEDDTLIPCQHNQGKSQISKAGIGFMLYSKHKVNELRKKYQKEHNIVYDYVLVIRPDIKLKKDFILKHVDNEISIQSTTTSRYCACNISNSNDFPVIGNIASDIVYFGKPETIDKVIDVLNKIDFSKHLESMWNPETLFNHELEKAGISSHFINYQYKLDWEILRKPDKRKIRKGIISLKIRRNLFLFHLLEILPISLLSLKFSIFGHFLFDICIGRDVNE
ncbi:MAG: hypothetical protein E7020_06970 [Alphaproteobacteria bacterium]|nr:hypothetical protein [Alphaproteobacteria bacterium]